MAHGARHVAFLGPPTITIHDDGNMLRQIGRGLYGHELFSYKIEKGTLPPHRSKAKPLIIYWK
jgi:hypothetical protein